MPSRSKTLNAVCCGTADVASRDLLHDRDGALDHERHGYRVGAHAVARDAAGGVAGVATRGRTSAMMLSRFLLLLAAYLVFVWYLWREPPLA